MKTTIIYSLIASCFFSLIVGSLTAQNTYRKDKWNFKLDYSQGPFTNLDGEKSGNIRPRSRALAARALQSTI